MAEQGGQEIPQLQGSDVTRVDDGTSRQITALCLQMVDRRVTGGHMPRVETVIGDVFRNTAMSIMENNGRQTPADQRASLTRANNAREYWQRAGRSNFPYPAEGYVNSGDFPDHERDYETQLLYLYRQFLDERGGFDQAAFTTWITGEGFNTVDRRNEGDFLKVVNVAYLMQKLVLSLDVNNNPNGGILALVDSTAQGLQMNVVQAAGGLTDEERQILDSVAARKREAFAARANIRRGSVDRAPESLCKAWPFADRVDGMILRVQNTIAT